MDTKLLKKIILSAYDAIKMIIKRHLYTEIVFGYDFEE